MCLNLYSGPWTISVFEAISLKVNEQKSYAEHHSEKKPTKQNRELLRQWRHPLTLQSEQALIWGKKSIIWVINVEWFCFDFLFCFDIWRIIIRLSFTYFDFSIKNSKRHINIRNHCGPGFFQLRSGPFQRLTV